MPGNSRPSSATNEDCSILLPNSHPALRPSYPSPASSAAAPLPPAGVPQQTTATSLSGKRRKKHKDTKDSDRLKKRRVVDGLDGDGPTAASAAVAGTSLSKKGPADFRMDKQMQLAMKDANLDDPQVVQDLERLYKAMLSFDSGGPTFVDGKWKLKGFGTTLFHHQLIGVSWMLGREQHLTGPKGGILADDMGLGKTVELLACMSQNLPARGSRTTKSLIIAPKRLLAQWYDEIGHHCSSNKMKKVFIYEARGLMANSQFENHNIM